MADWTPEEQLAVDPQPDIQGVRSRQPSASHSVERSALPSYNDENHLASGLTSTSHQQPVVRGVQPDGIPRLAVARSSGKSSQRT